MHIRASEGDDIVETWVEQGVVSLTAPPSPRHLPARGPDGEDRGLRPGHGEGPVERVPPGGAAIGVHTVDGNATHLNSH